MSVISISNLTFGYEGNLDNIFESLSFQIDTNWKLGFIGRNGKGKTTFLNLLTGKYEYQGTISASVSFSYFPFPVKDDSIQTLDLIDEVCPNYEFWELQRELNLLEVSDDVLFRPFGTLSNGEQTKVMLAVLFLRENNFLLIDEPTNHLDFHAREVVGGYLNRQKGFILVSHDRTFLDACIDHVLSINRMDIEVLKGNYSVWAEDKRLRDEFELHENEKLRREIKRLDGAAKRTGMWSEKAHRMSGKDTSSGVRMGLKEKDRVKAKKKDIQVRSMQKRIVKAREEKETLLRNFENVEDLKLHPINYGKQVLVRGKNLSLEYGGRSVFEMLSFTVERGEQVALTGKNGCGKSSLLKMILGDEIPYEGLLEVGNGLIVSYVPQDCDGIKGDLGTFAEINCIEKDLFLAILRKLDFSREDFAKDLSSYSQGQKKKVMLAKSLSEQAHFYIWDEPLNYIDVFSRIQIEKLIQKFRSIVK